MRLKIVTDETGVTTEAKLDGFDISSNLIGFQIKAQINEPTIVELSLMLVETDLDLVNVQIQGETYGGSKSTD